MSTLHNAAAFATAALLTGASSAAVINYAGQDFSNTGPRKWRTPTTPKGFDIDADNIYGTAGYIMFATSAIASSFESGNLTGNDLYSLSTANLTTLNNLPTGLTIEDGWFTPNRYIGGQFYQQIDDPNNPGQDIRLGFGGRNTFGNGNPGDSGNMFQLTVGPNLFGVGNIAATMRIGVFNHRDTGVGPAAAIRVVSPQGGDSGFQTDFGGNFGTSFMSFDVSDYQVGDVIEIWVQHDAANDRSHINGLTFDFIIPQPASLSLGLVGAALVTARRRR